MLFFVARRQFLQCFVPHQQFRSPISKINHPPSDLAQENDRETQIYYHYPKSTPLKRPMIVIISPNLQTFRNGFTHGDVEERFLLISRRKSEGINGSDGFAVGIAWRVASFSAAAINMACWGGETQRRSADRHNRTARVTGRFHNGSSSLLRAEFRNEPTYTFTGRFDFDRLLLLYVLFNCLLSFCVINSRLI